MQNYPWFKLYHSKVPHTLQPYPEIGPLDLFADNVRENPNHTMLIFDDRRLSWQEIDKASDELAAALSAGGTDNGHAWRVKKGDRVAVLFLNCPQTFIAYYAIWKLGGIVVPFNPLFKPYELEHLLNDVQPELAIIQSLWYPVFKSFQAKTSIRHIIATEMDEYGRPEKKSASHSTELADGDLWWDDLIGGYKGKNPPREKIDPQDTAVITFSGGTTGTPKGVINSHRSLAIWAFQLKAWSAPYTVYDEKDQFKDWSIAALLPVPIFHSSGIYSGFSGYIILHATMVLIQNPFDTKLILETIRKYGINSISGTPSMYIALLNDPDLRPDDLRNIHVATSGTATLSIDTHDRLQKLIADGGAVLDSYSMTEACCATTVSPPTVWKEGSVGVPVPDVIIRIIDMETGRRVMKPGELGEILIKSPQIMKGYWNRPQETAEVLRDGWLYTGDIGYLDEDGCLFLTARKKDVIKCEGRQVWPKAVEEVLAMHPAVAEVCVGGIPDTLQVEAVKAWVVLKPDRKVTPEELKEHCREKLISYKVPRFIEFRQSLPKTMLGKAWRHALQEEEKAKYSQV